MSFTNQVLENIEPCQNKPTQSCTPSCWLLYPFNLPIRLRIFYARKELFNWIKRSRAYVCKCVWAELWRHSVFFVLAGIPTNKIIKFLIHSSSRDSFASSRGKSISNEDLSPCTPNGPQQSQLGEKREPNGIVDTDDDFEPCEWRRISKLRRSLQLPSNSNSSIRNAYKFGSRPLDLPENLVSVSKIRDELENGSRLDRAMRNNHVDLVALNNILKGVPESGAWYYYWNRVLMQVRRWCWYNPTKKCRWLFHRFIIFSTGGIRVLDQHPIKFYTYSEVKLAVKRRAISPDIKEIHWWT